MDDNVQKIIEKLIKDAKNCLGNKDLLNKLFKDLDDKKEFVDIIKSKVEDFGTLIDLVKDYVSNKYVDIHVDKVTTALISLIYIVSPIDLIPDFIPGTGQADDISIAEYCTNCIRDELEKYKASK